MFSNSFTPVLFFRFKNDDEDEDDDENDEENDGFFVPHGYLSDDEGVHDSDGEKQEEKVDIRVNISDSF